jgi:hypothetical protein
VAASTAADAMSLRLLPLPLARSVAHYQAAMPRLHNLLCREWRAVTLAPCAALKCGQQAAWPLFIEALTMKKRALFIDVILEQALLR